MTILNVKAVEKNEKMGGEKDMKNKQKNTRRVLTNLGSSKRNITSHPLFRNYMRSNL